ncbi:histidine--tRNA ligase 1 [Paenibacillus sp. CCS19]|uniref:histidine--tRNA ligase n=1 Tax=Paenibacillus sp. CCS19 TaxID=3158387 RepID=UPI002567BD6C|nr:histidine--tRNA ligase [Paenibacillus cellulosilyticus]GMK41135.1 histidine--tRNA ligase 1 [Paenibacillus cellulosilyticus]
MSNVKGTTDYYGVEQAERSRMIRQMEELFALYDYEGIETAILNDKELLTAKYSGGDEIVQEMYTLSDRGQRELGLRYDLTVPFAKLVAAEAGLSLPFRRYELGKVFRDGPVKRGRLREFTQCDVDVVGIPGPEAEAELLSLAARVYEKLGIPVELRWNNRRFLSEWLYAAGIAEELAQTVMLTLDKIAKIGREAVRAELVDKGVPQPAADIVLKAIAAESGSDDDPSLAFEQLCAAFGVGDLPGAAEVRSLLALLDSVGLSSICRFDPSLSRGLSFYTGTVYEAFDASGSYTSSLGGGGRYDAIIGQLAGNSEVQYPTVGFSFGLEPIMEITRERLAPVETPPVIVVPIGGMSAEALRTANAIRACGIRTRLSPTGRKVGKALASAASAGCRFAVLIGEDEAQSDMVQLKDMIDRTEERLPVEEAIYRIERVLL